MVTPFGSVFIKLSDLYNKTLTKVKNRSLFFKILKIAKNLYYTEKMRQLNF